MARGFRHRPRPPLDEATGAHRGTSRPRRLTRHVPRTSQQAEEEDYTQRIIEYFNTGVLPLPEGTTLRAYLAERLNWCVERAWQRARQPPRGLATISGDAEDSV